MLNFQRNHILKFRTFARRKAYLDISCPGEEVSILVERHCHNAIGGKEGLLYTISVMDINVHVQHTINRIRNALQNYFSP